jgi:hypothetical protein
MPNEPLADGSGKYDRCTGGNQGSPWSEYHNSPTPLLTTADRLPSIAFLHCPMLDCAAWQIRWQRRRG